ncbi:MAG: hypothetical protein HFH27_09805 [Clostridiaceae bacterium]|nr:hypothetical protein [Clostridiaceae bacterium]
MKIGFNQANDRFCAGHSVMRDLELCEQYGLTASTSNRSASTATWKAAL